MMEHRVVRRQVAYLLPTAVAFPVTMLLALMFVACAQGSSVSSMLRAPTPTAIAASTRTEAEATSRIHNVSPGGFTLFARITFTIGTTYDQAAAILGGRVYPWTCDDPAAPTPPPVVDQRAGFSSTHTLLISYGGWDELVRIARSPQVVSVDADPLYPCP
jgi:hypothetical protein